MESIDGWEKIRRDIFKSAKTREINRVSTEILEHQRVLAKIREKEASRIEERLRDPRRYSYDTERDMSWASFECSSLSDYKSSWNPWIAPPCETYKQIATRRGFSIYKCYGDSIIVGIKTPSE